MYTTNETIYSGRREPLERYLDIGGDSLRIGGLPLPLLQSGVHMNYAFGVQPLS